MHWTRSQVAPGPAQRPVQRPAQTHGGRQPEKQRGRVASERQTKTERDRERPRHRQALKAQTDTQSQTDKQLDTRTEQLCPTVPGRVRVLLQTCVTLLAHRQTQTNTRTTAAPGRTLPTNQPNTCKSSLASLPLLPPLPAPDVATSGSGLTTCAEKRNRLSPTPLLRRHMHNSQSDAQSSTESGMASNGLLEGLPPSVPDSVEQNATY